jgi:hypothetical protein
MAQRIGGVTAPPETGNLRFRDPESFRESHFCKAPESAF